MNYGSSADKKDLTTPIDCSTRSVCLCTNLNSSSEYTVQAGCAWYMNGIDMVSVPGQVTMGSKVRRIQCQRGNASVCFRAFVIQRRIRTTKCIRFQVCSDAFCLACNVVVNRANNNNSAPGHNMNQYRKLYSRIGNGGSS